MLEKTNEQLYVRQICLFFIAFLPPIKLFYMPSVLASAFENDIWLSSLFSSIIDIFCVLIFLSITKKYDCDFYALIKKLSNETVAKVIYFLYSIMFFIKGIVPIIELCLFAKLTLYEAVATDFYFLPFFILPIYLSTKPLKIIGRLADVMWIFTIFGSAILITMAIPSVDFFNILPVNVYFKSNLLTNFQKPFVWFGDSIYLLFFMGSFKIKKRDTIKICLSFILQATLVTFCMIIFYSIFMSTAKRQIFSISEIAKYSTSINNTARFDYLGVFCFLLVNIISVSLPIYFFSFTIKKAINIGEIYSSIFYAIFMTIFILFFKQYLLSGTNFIIDTLSYFLFALNLFPVLCYFLCKVFLRKKTLLEKNYEIC